MTRISYEVQLSAEDHSIEDGGAAHILQADHPDDECFFVRMQSYDELEQHALIKKLVGKRVRITIDVLE